MDEQRAWLKARRKRRLRILAVMLSVCVLFTTYPDILATLSVFASEEQAQAEGRYISGFTALSNEIREQTVPVGTELTELSLPDTLEAVVTKQPSEDTAGQPEEDGKEDSEENDGEESDGDTTGTEDKDSSTGETEEGEPSDSGQENTEENNATDAGEETGDEQDTQPEKGGESEETDGKAAAGNEETADTEKEENTEESAPAEEKQESAVSQETHTVTMQEYHAENVISVQTLENTQTEKQEETVTIDGVTWQSDPEYDGNAEGIYIFTAVLPEGYALAEDVSLPEITVTVEVESGIDVIIQALLDRIAALPGAEEYLALEPDMEEDEDAYAEWEEKLYEYTEEALAIWEEYEALTEEQQAQISEEELTRLAAWVEFAEQLSDYTVMLADDSEHHAGWTALSSGDIELTSGNYYLAGPVSMGTITIKGDVTLCLNGQTLTHSGDTGSVIVVESGTFTLCDCQDDYSYIWDGSKENPVYTLDGSGGCITGGNGYNSQGGGVYVKANATFVMNSGRITGCNVGTGEGHDGGGVYVATQATFEMAGGFIEDNAADSGGGVGAEGCFIMSNKAVIMNNVSSSGGGGVGITSGSGSFTMRGGKIIGNTASSFTGGGVEGYLDATISMEGGLIEGNSAKTGGGGLYITTNSPTKLSGGTIRYNRMSGSAGLVDAGGVRLLAKASMLELSGSIYIYDNYYKDGTISNVYLPTNASVTITGPLTNRVGITSQTKPANGSGDNGAVVVANENTSEDYDWHCIVSDENYRVIKSGNQILLAERTGNSVTINAYKDGLEWVENPPAYKLTSDNGTSFVTDLTAVPDGEYQVYDGDTDTGVTVKVDSAAAEVSMDYYTVTFYDGDNELTTPTQQIVLKGATAFAPTDNPTKTGYTFIKWVTVDGGSTAYDFTQAVNAKTLVYASWTPIEYTISYNLAGGTLPAGKTNPENYTIETADFTLQNPADRIGYTFTGWSGTGLDANTLTVSILQGSIGHRTYTANWEPKNYNVTLYPNGGGTGTDLNSYTFGKGATLPTGWTRTGYDFVGWYDNKDCTGTAVTEISTTDTGDKKYWANWTPISYSISYELNGGTVTGNPTTYTIESNAITLVNPSKTGYSFAGWSGTDLAGSNHMSVTIAAGSTGDREYTANWTAAGYTVTLKGGGTGTALTSYTYGIGATLPTDWTKTGYTFAGWYNNENCTGDPVAEISATDTGDKTFWAKWTPQTYQVTFHYHGADGGDTTASQNVTYNSKYGILPVPTRTGYTFQGWYTEADGKGTEVNAGTTVTTASAHTLHAYWKDETAPNKPVLQDGVTLPADTDWTNTQTTIPLKLYDGVGVDSLLVSVDGSPYTEVSGFSGGTGSMTYDYTPVLEGKHTYQFIAKDAAGHTSVASDIFTVRLDQTKPVIGTLTYDNAVHLNFWHWIIGKKSIVIHVPVTDAGSGVTEISYTRTDKDAAGNLITSSAATDTATVTNGEAKITIAADFRGIIAISCTDAAGNAADGVTIGAAAGGVIVEDTPPTITVLADRNISDTHQTHPSGVNVSEEYYNSAPALFVTVKDDTGNAITAGIATVRYKVGDGTEQSVAVNTSALQEEVTFTIPASEIPTGITEIKVTATDNAGNGGNEAAKTFTVKVKGPEKMPAAEIDYREEKLKNLVPGAAYTIDGTAAYTADGEGRIPIKESWLNSSISIVKKGNGSETSDSLAQSLSVPPRPAAPDTPELSTRDNKSITLKTILNAQYRLADGTDNWQDSPAFTGLDQKTIYRFRAYYPATDTSFASRESNEAQIATMPTAPTPDKLRIGYAAETLTLTDGIEAFTDQSCTTSVTAGSVTAYMGQTVYIRYPADGIIPASLTTAVSIPARPAKPTPGKEDASYPKATDGAITGLMPGTTYEYRVKAENGDFGAWKAATPSGTKIENLPAGDYEVRVKAVETGNASFQSETAAVTIGADPATKYETPKIRIDYPAETLTGFVPGAKYTIGSDTITAGADGTLPIKKEWFGTTLSITRNGNDKDKLDSDPQSLPIPARPAKPTPTGVDVSTAGGTGKLTGLTAGTAYEVSTDGGKTWVSHTADGSGQITGLAPGTYVVRVKAGTDHFVSEPSDSVKIGAYQIKVTFMVDGTKYREVSVDYGAALTDIPPVPAKDNAIGAWCMDEQGTTPAVFTNITADMTVYAVYTTAYTVTLQTGTGYTLSAQGDSESPVKEGGSFTFRFALADGYQRNADFAVKVNGVKVELTAQEPYTYTITDIRENKTVTVEGVGKKPGGKPADGGDKEKDPKPEPEDPSPKPDDTDPENPAPKPPVTPPAKPTSPAPGETPPAEKQPEGRPGTTPKQEETTEPAKTGEPEEEPGTEAGTPKPDGTDSGRTTGTPAKQAEVKIGDGTVIVTVVCEEEKCTATVADTEKVVKAVLTPDQQELVNGGETIEIRIDVTDISEKVPAQDKEVIEGGIEAYREEVPGLVLGMYVDISMFIKIGAGDWNAITATDEPIEVVIDIPEKLLSDGREFYIIRSHNGEYTFMDDLDDTPDTITVSTDLFSSYAIAYVETEGAGADNGAKCGLCHICPTFLGICYFIWLAFIIAVIAIVVFAVMHRKKEEEPEERKG